MEISDNDLYEAILLLIETLEHNENEKINNNLFLSSLKFVDLTNDFYISDNYEYFGTLPSHRKKINEIKMIIALNNYSKIFRNKIIDIPDIDKRLEKGLRNILRFSSTSSDPSWK